MKPCCPDKLGSIPPLDLALKANLSGPALSLIVPDMKVPDLVGAMQGIGLNQEVVPLLAFALPAREAIWWASQSVRLLAASVALPGISMVALEAVETWVVDLDAGDVELALDTPELKFDQSVTWAAQAVTFAVGGVELPSPEMSASLGLPGLPDLCAQAVSGSILLSVAQLMLGVPTLPTLPPLPALPSLALPSFGIPAFGSLPSPPRLPADPGTHEALIPFVDLGADISCGKGLWS